MANITVTMMVDVANLQGTGGTPANSCTLIDSNGDTPGSETFEVMASSGDTVQFLLAANDGVTCVQFVSFVYESGLSTVFSTLPASSNNWTGTASGTSGQEESYYINFKVAGTQYQLDPKIKIDSGG